jgi:hypothetical protein
MGHHTKTGRDRILTARAIRRWLANLTLAECKSQWDSPIFRKLPIEIRLLIWEFVLAEEKISVLDDFGMDLEVKSVFHLGLLFTCRRVYLEASSIPLKKSALVVRPYSESCLITHRELRRFTAKNMADFHHAILLSDDIVSYSKRFPPGSQFFSIRQFRPRRLTLWDRNNWCATALVSRGHLSIPDSVQTFSIEVWKDDRLLKQCMPMASSGGPMRALTEAISRSNSELVEQLKHVVITSGSRQLKMLKDERPPPSYGIPGPKLFGIEVQLSEGNIRYLCIKLTYI